MAYTDSCIFRLKINDSGNQNEVQRLVNGFNIDSVDGNGNTALILAAERGDEQWII